MQPPYYSVGGFCPHEVPAAFPLAGDFDLFDFTFPLSSLSAKGSSDSTSSFCVT